MTTILINKEKLHYDIQTEIAKILNISFFDVEEISDIDLDMIIGSIDGMIINYTNALANRQLQNEAIYDKMIPSAYEEIQKIKKEEYERNKKQNKSTRF